ncbi:MAG: hypothetical protein PHO08_18215, partial [Methylococcales bacterium]|nr:hypothetical protein [Methylococcales bacterium]
NTNSGKSRKVFSLKPESVFNLNQNRCSDWFRMGVQVEPEYAPCDGLCFVNTRQSAKQIGNADF